MSTSKDLQRGFKWSSLMQVSIVLIQFISTIFLARLLTPSDYALIGMVAIFISISDMIVDSGMGGALVKKADVSSIDYSTLFFYNLFSSLVLYGILFVTSPYVADFYDKPILKLLIRIISLSIIVNALCKVQYIRLLRSLDYKIIAIISLISNAISLVIALFLALNDYGVWTLVWQQLLTVIITTVLYMLYNRFLPSLVFSMISFKEQFSFGIYLLGSNVLFSISDNVHSNVLAKVVSFEQTGYFVQANKVKTLPINFLRSVIDNTLFPVFAKIHDIVIFREKFRKVAINLYVIIFSVIVFLSSISNQIVKLLLGNQWVQCSWMVSYLLIGVIPFSIQIICRNALKSLGATREIFFQELLKTFMVMLVLMITFKLGIEFIVLGIVFSQVISAFFIMRAIQGKAGYGFKEHLGDILPIFCINFISYMLLKLTFLFLHTFPIVEILVAFIQHVILVLTFSILFKHSQTIKMWKTLKAVIVRYIINKQN